MTSSAPLTEPAEQQVDPPSRTVPASGAAMHRPWEWLTPGLLVSTVLSLVALLAVVTFGLVAIQLNSSADIRNEILNSSADIRSEIRDSRAEFVKRMDQQDARIENWRTELRSEIRDSRAEFITRMDEQDAHMDQLSARMDQQGARTDKIYQLLLPAKP